MSRILSWRSGLPHRLTSRIFCNSPGKWGFELTETDVLDAQKRAMEQGSASALQRAQAEESRRLRNFIHG
ncbi:MAG: hypothetical protein CM15mP77_2470 [Synechococcus sp.]|nr:MAG: hypothetical protein CM15mP77_2470 [Synechococcus sp.]